MARPRKILDFQKGNLTQQQQIEKEQQEAAIKNDDEQLEKPPSWLVDSVAKKEWKRLVVEFKKLKIINNLDMNNLGSYCNAYSFYRKITKELKNSDMLISFTNKFGATNMIENPLVKLQIKYSDEMKKYSSLLGLTIDSRLKIGEIKTSKQKNNIINEFGDI